MPDTTDPPTTVTIDPSSPEVKALIQQENAAIQNHRDKVLAEKRELEAKYRDQAEKLKALEDKVSGLDMDSLRSMLADQEKKALLTELESHGVDGFKDRLLKSVNEAHENELNAVRGELDKASDRASDYEGKYTQMLMSAKVRDAAGDQVQSDLMGNFVDYVSKSLKVGDDNRVRVVDEDGKVRFKGSEEMTVAQFVEEIRASRPSFFKGSSGGGAPGSTGVKGRSGSIVLSREDRNNPQKYRAAKEEAQKRGVKVEFEA